MSKIWKIKETITPAVAEELSEFPSLARQMLFNRGLDTAAAAKDFLQPQYENLHSPFLFQDMERAVERIWRAIEAGEKICIYGDYDADAVTANAVLRQTFKYLNFDNVESYIPDRFTEGYGVNLEALSKIKDQGSTVIITVDCGTNSCDAAEFCKNNGIDFIITDHHEIIGPVPEAYALINPKNPNDKYPYHEIVRVTSVLVVAIVMGTMPFVYMVRTVMIMVFVHIIYTTGYTSFSFAQSLCFELQ
jgi:single-stranded-DNA-specific exonuclease